MENPEKFLITAGGRITCLRCTAMSKHTRLQCLKPALKISKTQKCNFHGGKSTGPKSAEGKARVGAAHLVHGNETKQVRLERSQGALRMAQLEDLLHVAGLTTADRTTGRKPAGYRRISTVEEARQYMVDNVLRRVKGLSDSD